MTTRPPTTRHQTDRSTANRLTAKRFIALGLGAAAFSTAVLATTVASAQDSAAAEELFNKGVADLESGKLETACPALAESQRLDPRAGTLFTLAECHAQSNKLATAVAEYTDYQRMVARLPADQQALHADRLSQSEAAIAKLKPQVPKLTLQLPAGAPAGTVVLRDSVELQGASLGLALPVDPGVHTVTVRLPTGEEHKETVELAAGATKTLTVQLPKAAAPKVGSGRAVMDSTSPTRSVPNRTVPLIIGGVGVAGLALGAVTGILSLDQWGKAKDDCNGPACRTQAGKDAADSSKSLGMIANIGFGVGIVGVGVSAVMLLTGWPSSPAEERSAEARPRKNQRATADRLRTIQWTPVVAGDSHGGFVGLNGSF